VVIEELQRDAVGAAHDEPGERRRKYEAHSSFVSAAPPVKPMLELESSSRWHSRFVSCSKVFT
jgi:hypothetical protein